MRAAKIPAAAIALLGVVTSAPRLAAPISTPTANATPMACPVGGDLAPAPPRADPRGFFSEENTLITVTSQVPYTPFLGLIKSRVTLLRVDERGYPIATLGTMYDDGSHGDAQPGDGQYTGQFTFNEAAAGPIFLAVRARYQSTSAAHQSNGISCRQSYNNDRQIIASGPRPSAAQLQAEYAVFNAADAYYVSDVAEVGPVQARQDLIKFLLSSYGPDGTVNRGLVVSAVPGPDGESVWWTYNDGLDAGLTQATPGVKGSGSPKKPSRNSDKPGTTTTCRIGETRAPVPPRGTPQEFRAGLSTKIDATLQVTLYPNLIPVSVTLLQVDRVGTEWPCSARCVATAGTMTFRSITLGTLRSQLSDRRWRRQKFSLRRRPAIQVPRGAVSSTTTTTRLMLAHRFPQLLDGMRRTWLRARRGITMSRAPTK